MSITGQTTELAVRVDGFLPEADGSSIDWNALVDASTYPNVFRRWEWLSTWWKWFGKGRELSIVRVSDGPDVVAIVPLYVYSDRSRIVFRPRALTFVGFGGPTCPEYLGPIVHRDYADSAVPAIADFLSSREADWDALNFPDVAPDDLATAALIRALESRHPAVSRPGETCPCVDLPESYDALLARLSSHGRQRERRQVRKAQSDFRVELLVADANEAVRTAFSAVVALSRSSRARRGDCSPFANAAYGGLHREVIERLLPDGISRLYLLAFDGKPVAFQYGYVYRGKYYDFQNGFDAAFERYSPGAVLLQLILQKLIDEGVEEFDFLRGEETYKHAFADRERNTRTTVVYRRRGLACLLGWASMRPLRRLRSFLKNHLPFRKHG